MIMLQESMILILILIACLKLSLGALDANAILLECKKDSSKNDIKRTSPPYHTIDNCSRKIRITFNISNSGKTPPDLDYSFLSQLSDPDSGKKMYLLNPIVLRLKQDQVLLTYPFNYLSAVNGKASEIVVNYENRQNFTGCDDTSQINPTCGLKHDRGKAVPYSEGFCCFCPEMPVKEKQIRGGQDCSLDVGDPADIEKQKFKASAHCLQFSDVWYSVSALSEPAIIHETYMQVYNQRHLKNGSSVWVALTHDEDFELGSRNPFQYDENKTIVISYLTSAPQESSITLPISERRLLTPQPMPAIELAKLPTSVKNGATDYLLMPKNIINPVGEECDVAGISYEAFVKQNDRCNVVKDTCLKNQPLDFWEADDEKRKSGAKGTYLLENYGTPYKDPVIVDPETKEHVLALEYYEPHLTSLIVEINADEIAIMSVGKRAQISKIISSSMKSKIEMLVSVLNGGLMPAKFTVEAIKCGFSVADSNKESVVIPPQMTQDVLIFTTPGGVTLDEKFSCTVQVSNEEHGVLASRKVSINPHDRCVCNFHCECACLLEGLKCEPMEIEDYQAAGFLGSLPILTAKPPHRNWFIKHPFLALLAIILFLLLIGFIKGILGLAGFMQVKYFGMEKFLYQPKKIKRYLERELRNTKVIYDAEGYPINPDTKQRARVIGDELLFAFNLLFPFIWPCDKLKDCITKKNAAKKKKDDSGGASGAGATGGFLKKLFRKTDDSKGGHSKKQGIKTGKHVSQKRKSPTEKGSAGTKGRPTGTDKDLADTKRGPTGAIGSQRIRSSISDSELERESTGPVADPLNKELARWQKGTGRIQAVRK